MSDTDKTDWEFIKIGLDPEDLELLNRCVTIEKLSRADVLRRALRDYARKAIAPLSESKVA